MTTSIEDRILCSLALSKFYPNEKFSEFDVEFIAFTARTIAKASGRSFEDIASDILISFKNEKALESFRKASKEAERNPEGVAMAMALLMKKKFEAA